MAVRKEDLTKLIQQLSDENLPIVESFLKKLLNRTQRPIPWDDEPTTQDDLDTIKKAKEAFKRGEGIKFRDVEDELFN